MKFNKLKKAAALCLSAAMLTGLLAGCSGDKAASSDTSTSSGTTTEGEASTENREVVELIWYQIGDGQKDAQMVIDKVNEYTMEKIGVKLKVNYVGWGDYNQKLQVVINTGDDWDLCFTSSWANDYVQNVQKGAFLPLDEYLETVGKEMYDNIDPRFWQAARVGEKVYGVPSEKEIGNCPMWVFTKEYVDKYDIPYQDIKSLEDLEPWLKVIKENEPDVVPLYLTRDYSAPTYMDKIQDPVGIEYEDSNLTVQNLFQTEKMISTLETMRSYYLAGYINKDAANAYDDKSIKRFVTKGDGQPYAELIWSKD